mmetsp:Transcript_133248/g.385652  ORF Transcript_133248/g.385652 Transcript_133248/m.385652 type:complete len:221 (+) Transcript_133248:505-1167(+)
MLDIGALARERHLRTRRSPLDELRQLPLAYSLQTLVHLGRVHLALNNVQNRDVHAPSSRTRHHDVLGVQKSPHDVEHSRLANGGGLSVYRQGGIPRHEEVAPRCRDQGGEHADQVVVHVAGVSQCRGACGHNGGDQRVDLRERRILQLQPVHCYPVQRGIIQHDNTIRIQGEPLQREYRVVGLDNNIAGFGRKQGKHRVCLYQLLWISVVDILEQVRSDT